MINKNNRANTKISIVVINLIEMIVTITIMVVIFGLGKNYHKIVSNKVV